MSFYTFARGLVKIYYKFMFRMDIQGEEHIPKEGGVVLCCNHMSNFDPTTMAAFVKRPVRYIAKKELFEKRWSAKLLSSLGAFPVDRQTTDMKALKTAIKLLKNGEALGIFAEGTRVKEGEAKEMCIRDRYEIGTVGSCGGIPPVYFGRSGAPDSHCPDN